MAHGDWENFGKLFWNHHKRQFGMKLEVAVATQRRPIPIATRVAPAGTSDIRMAREGIFRRMRPGEQALGDPGYQGEPSHIYAPPRRNMHTYVPELDKTELTLQRRVEMANQRIKSFKCVGTIYRKGAVHAAQELTLLGMLIPKLVLVDMLYSDGRAGEIHFRHVSGKPTVSTDTSKVVVGKKPRRSVISKPTQSAKRIARLSNTLVRYC